MILGAIGCFQGWGRWAGLVGGCSCLEEVEELVERRANVDGGEEEKLKLHG